MGTDKEQLLLMKSESVRIYEQFPVLLDHQEYLKELKRSDILGVGTQGIVVKSQETETVVKIALSPESFCILQQEYLNQESFLLAIRHGKKLRRVSAWIHVPEIDENIDLNQRLIMQLVNVRL